MAPYCSVAYADRRDHVSVHAFPAYTVICRVGLEYPQVVPEFPHNYAFLETRKIIF